MWRSDFPVDVQNPFLYVNFLLNSKLVSWTCLPHFSAYQLFRHFAHKAFPRTNPRRMELYQPNKAKRTTFFSNLIILKPCGTSFTNVLKFSGLALLGDNSLSHFCTFPVSFSSEVPYVMVVSQIDVEDRDHICFWGRGQICFLTKIIKIMSPSGFARGPFKGLLF